MDKKIHWLALLGMMTLPAYASTANYGSIELCDGLTLQDDSAQSWGCWTQFEAPAAGPVATAALQAASDQPSPPNNPEIDSGVCPAGSQCGYATYTAKGQKTAGIMTDLVVTGSDFSMTDPDLGVPVSGTFEAGQQSDLPGTMISSGEAITSDSYTGYNWNAGLNAYINGSKRKWGYVAGIPTTALELINLSSGNVTASYSGHELITGDTVNITVNFGNSTWTGAWAGSANWSANGTVSAGKIASSGIGGAYNAGAVQGTFYGTNAQGLGGAAKVWNTATPAVIHNDVFAAARN